MKTKSFIRLALIGMLFFCVAGCFDEQQFNKQRYLLEVNRHESTPPKTSSVALLSVEPFAVNSAFRGQGIIYKRSRNEYESSFYHEYLIPPAKMITEQTSHWLSDSGLFKQVLQPGSIMKPTHLLEGYVSRIYADSSDSSKVNAQLAISFYLMSREPEEILLVKTYAETVPMDSASTEYYFMALETALTKILQQYERDIASVLQ